MIESTIGAALERAAASTRGIRFLDRRENETFLGYDQVYRRARIVAGTFQRLGIRPGDKIALVLPTAPEFFDAFYGAQLLGAVPVPLYPPVRLGRLDEYHLRTAQMMQAADVRLVCTDPRINRILGRTLAGAKPDLGCLLLEEPAGEPATPPAIDPDAPALIQFSSGTTITPKPVLLTHRQILANVATMEATILKAYPEKSGIVHSGVCWLPLYHDMGLIGCIILALYHVADITLIPPELFIARPAVWLRALSKYRGTISPAPNFAYSLCADRIKDEDLAGVDLSHWLCALNGAEPVTPSVLDRFIERFQPFGLREEALTPVYGLAEAALAVTFYDLKKRFRITHFNAELLAQGKVKADPQGKPLVCLGAPLPGYELRFIDEDGEPCRRNEIGQVWVKGPSIMQGYYGRTRETERALVDGWLNTGDLGFLYRGHLYLYGRAKDLIIIRGRNYAPQMIEQAINDLPGVRKGCTAAIGFVPEEGENEGLIVFVERDRSGNTADDGRLGDEVSRRITEMTQLVAETVVVLDPGTLPRTSSGKIRRGETLKRYQADTLSPPKQMSVLRLAAEMMRSKIAAARLAPPRRK